MLLAAEFGTGQVLWSIFWFFLFFLWIMLVFNIFGDIMRSDDLSGASKAIWAVFIIFLPYLGIFVYLIARGKSMAQRDVEAAEEFREAQLEYTKGLMKDAAKPATPAEQIAHAKELLDSGAITAEEFDKLKAKALV